MIVMIFFYIHNVHPTGETDSLEYIFFFFELPSFSVYETSAISDPGGGGGPWVYLWLINAQDVISRVLIRSKCIFSDFPGIGFRRQFRHDL